MTDFDAITRACDYLFRARDLIIGTDLNVPALLMELRKIETTLDRIREDMIAAGAVASDPF